MRSASRHREARLRTIRRFCGFGSLRRLRFAGYLSSRFRILPVGPFGSASTNSTLRGYL